MAKITKEIQDFIAGKLGWVATADKNGLPNLAPKGTLKVLDDESLVFADLFSLKTRAFLESNPQVAVAVIDKATGYQFKGKAELLTSGPIFEQVSGGVKAAMPDVKGIKYAVKIKVDSVYSLSPGPDAGKKLA
ncbi:MAG: pyridoxamine 5'-phosphate oxidase family protein [Deltaproteobacteria bacterium]|jgi:predicted pyridoxine 5'-phosphate oxidase superfamily flavin-nucleotide-binding protein|nr:pyridoxamine 5'-phosphate oxidase family protein [Deltaproteobacteria bacterium]